jgi:hypothetical protein
MAYEAQYWQRKGRFWKLYEQLFVELVPKSGTPKTYHGKLLLYVSNIYYDIYNNGGCNLDLPLFQRRAGTLLEADRELQPLANRLSINKFPEKLAAFAAGKGNAKVHDQIVDVVVKYVEREHKRTARVRQLIKDAEWVVDFLEQHPPHFSDGRSMETDLGKGLNMLAASLRSAKSQLGIPTPAYAR